MDLLTNNVLRKPYKFYHKCASHTNRGRDYNEKENTMNGQEEQVFIPEPRVGQRVSFNRDARPYDILTGVIIEERPDRDFKSYRKPMRYIIRPDKPMSSTYKGDVVRYHPPMTKHTKIVEGYQMKFLGFMVDKDLNYTSIENVTFLENPLKTKEELDAVG